MINKEEKINEEETKLDLLGLSETNLEGEGEMNFEGISGFKLWRGER